MYTYMCGSFSFACLKAHKKERALFPHITWVHSGPWRFGTDRGLCRLTEEVGRVLVHSILRQKCLMCDAADVSAMPHGR